MRPVDDRDTAPQEAPWSLPFGSCPYVVFDCEMTGADPARDALVEVAARRVEGGAVTATLDTLVHTEVPSDPVALAMHGIDAEALATAPRFEEVAPRLADILRGAVPVAHGADLDVVFLDRAFEAAGCDARVGPVLDTVLLARRAFHAQTYALEPLCRKLGIGPFRWHRAAEDVAAVAALFARLVEVFRPETAQALWEVRVGQQGPVRVRSSVAELLARVQGTGRPVTLTVRTPGREAFDIVARIDAWRSPYARLLLGPRGNRGVRMLRADRVLRAEEGARGPSARGW